MPRENAAELDEALNKKGGLTLSQLANYDDLITDALVDRVYYWSTIRKLKANFHPSRHVREEEICHILQREVVINKDAVAAQKALLQMSGLARYVKSLRTTDEKEHFERHLRKYVNIYLPDCPFEVCTTNRYTINTSEACIVARKRIRTGEPIKYLSGIQVEMSEEEEHELCSRTDFSIVVSSRRKRPSLFLGPARFANHDCNSNAKLSTSGPHGIHIMAVRSIAPGEEITVQYGVDYFGEKNCECLCRTCELRMQNGWDPRGPILNDDSSDEDDEDKELEDQPKRKKTATPKPAPPPKPKVVKPAAGALKRKRGQESPSEVQFVKESMSKPCKKRKTKAQLAVAEEDVTPAYTTHAQQHMLDWFSRRASDEEVIEESDQDDEVEVDELDDDIMIKQEPTDETKRDMSPSSEHKSILTRIIEFMAGTTNREADDLEAKLNRKKERVASLLNVPTEQVEAFYPQDSIEEAVGPYGIPLYTPRVEDQVTPDQLAQWRYATGRELPPSPPKTREAVVGATRERTPPYAEGFSHQVEQVSGAKRDQKITASLDVRKSRLPSIKKNRSISSLRNVVNADDGSIDLFSVPDSPASVDTVKPKRGRQSILLRDSKGETSAAPREAAHSSNESSSMSSIFSNESRVDQVSPTSSAGATPSAPGEFSAGSICQDIVNMYTSNLDGSEEPEEEQPKGKKRKRNEVDDDDSEEPFASRGRQRGRMATRKSARQAGSQTPVALESIEQTRRGRSTTANATANTSDSDEEQRRGTPRIPLDYTLCEALLITSNHRWVECRNCDEHFVQADAYQTRIACPRCERHSKLYGYHWPKTDKENKWDTQERILDHRTIHRFIDPDEERMERKGRKTLLEVLRDRSSERESSWEGAGRSESHRRVLRERG